MKELTKRILLVVVLAGFVSIAGFLFMVDAIEYITQQYSVLVDEQMVNRQMMSRIGSRMYYLQSLTGEYALNLNRDELISYEERLAEYEDEVQDMFDELNSTYTQPDDLEMVHTVYRSYNEFTAQADIVVKLCKKEYKKAAEYYVCNIMREYLDEADRNLRSADRYMEDKITSLNEKMQDNIEGMRVMRNWCMIVMLICMLSCIVITFRMGRRIVNAQSEQEKQHADRIMDIQNKTIMGMANLIESRDGDTGQHVKRTSAYVKMIAERMIHEGVYKDVLTDEYVENLCKAAPMHDIGKIMIPDSILQKPGKLTPEEFEIIKSHTVEGGKAIYMALGEIEEKEYLKVAHEVVMYHHEKWNGEGYPEKLSGEEIPLCARIMAVADVFDALVSKRCYKNPFPVDESYAIIEESSGTHFDPAVVTAFLHIKNEICAYLDKEI